MYSISTLSPQSPPLAPSSPPYVISTWVCTICGPNPPPPCDLLHSGKEMEVIHSGNCDCPFPGGRGDAPGRPQRSFPRGRAHHPTRPRVAWTGLGRGRGRCAARPPGSALHLPPPPGARERCGSPPSALCYSPTSCLWSPTPAYFPGREAAEGREFLGDTPTGSSLLPPPSPAPGPGTARG